MNTESLYWFCHGKNFKEMRKNLLDHDKEILADTIINEYYNNLLARYADFKKDEQPVDPAKANGKHNNKRIPYMGWFWRNLDFAKGKIPIGFSESYIGFMENNKWDYHERHLTQDELESLMIIIDEACRINERGGEINKIHQDLMAQLEKIYPFIVSLPRLAK